ncbi:MAG: restriction endonuclease subunit S [Cryomorphaceae bacterium]|nr:restriction endonuclease subunit S [Cryomorphaceae bacterium]
MIKMKDDKKLKGAVLIIGSLWWDENSFRKKLRDDYLLMSESKLVDAPIRYGRFSDKRKTYTMVFSSSLVTKSQKGKAYLIPILEKYCNTESVIEVAHAIINAEYKSIYENERFNWGWGCLPLLLNPKKQNSQIQTLSSLWNDHFSNGFNPDHYKVGDESPSVNRNGQLQIPWSSEFNNFDFIISTSTKPNSDSYPDSKRLIEIFKQDDKYFRKNVDSGISTFQDKEIADGLKSQWTNKRLEEICNHFKSGAGIVSKAISQKGKYPVFGGNGLRGFTDSYTHEGQYLLIGRQGALCGNIQKIKGKNYISEHAIAVQVNNDNDLNFLAYKLDYKNLNRLSESSAQPGLSVAKLLRIKLKMPPLPEQRAIAQCLSTWDHAIHTTEKLIAQKELRKKWLMQQLLTGKKRLEGFEGEWNKQGAGEVFKSVSLKGFTDGILLSATQDRGMIPRTMLEGRVTMPTTGTESFKLVEVGDFVISLRSFQGGIEYSYYRGLVSPAYTVLKPKKPVDEEFYKQYFKSHDFIGHLAIAVIGIRDGKQISYDDFCTVKIPYPSIKEQTVIALVLQTADKEISLLKSKVEELKEQKKGLMQVLLTGKKRIKI